MDAKNSFLRALPAVDRILQEEPLQEIANRIPYSLLLEVSRESIDHFRDKIIASSSGGELEKLTIDPAVIAAEAAERARLRFLSGLRPVINATGVILHTNLGRAPLAEQAIRAVTSTAGQYSNLELSLESGQRDSRLAHVEGLICTLTGAEASLIVNNNAAAVLLVLNTLAKDREVIVSRGQLVEIGGGFRIPDVMKASGATLVEVGTTNKCYRHDYERAISDRTALLLKVHTSNYRIIGFTEEVSRKELVSLGRQVGLPVVEDLGSGAFYDFTAYGLPPEPTVQECLEEGVGAVSFSGDKILGGPQAGIIVGDRDLIRRLRDNQLSRALRVDKLTIAAMEATLRLYHDHEKARCEIPVLGMLTADTRDLKARADRLLRRLKQQIEAGDWQVMEGASCVGGGAMPLAELPTYLISYRSGDISAEELMKKLRWGDPPLIARVHQEHLLLDLRTILPEQEGEIVTMMMKAVNAGG